MLNNVAMFLLFYSGEVLIGMFVGTAAVTPYAIARSLVQYLSTIIGSMTQVFHPYASDQHERGNAAAVSDALVIGTKTSLLIALPIGVAYLIVGPTFVELWMGHGYGQSTGTAVGAADGAADRLAVTVDGGQHSARSRPASPRHDRQSRDRPRRYRPRRRARRHVRRGRASPSAWASRCSSVRR